jgi:hypothetical protein
VVASHEQAKKIGALIFPCISLQCAASFLVNEFLRQRYQQFMASAILQQPAAPTPYRNVPLDYETFGCVKIGLFNGEPPYWA